MVRPRKYFAEEERKQAKRRSNTNYMLNKEWLCPDCGNRDTHWLENGHISDRKNISEMQPKIKPEMGCIDCIYSIFNIQEHYCFWIF